MTWIVVISIILLAVVKLSLTCLPTPVVEWFVSKFELHSKLSDATATITIDGKHIEGNDKIQVINYFNEATFLKQYYIHPGNEHYYLHPEYSGTPLVIDTKRGKHDVRLFVYSYGDHVDVVKQYKKKIIAYRLLSDSLQKRSMLVTGDIV
ncbi:hypothetical protein FZC66_08665 [Priestia megaterium]|nr:hypothetical protein FZC66_08665 [Priestia megaterium]